MVPVVAMRLLNTCLKRDATCHVSNSWHPTKTSSKCDFSVENEDRIRQAQPHSVESKHLEKYKIKYYVFCSTFNQLAGFFSPAFLFVSLSKQQ